MLIIKLLHYVNCNTTTIFHILHMLLIYFCKIYICFVYSHLYFAAIYKYNSQMSFLKFGV